MSLMDEQTFSKSLKKRELIPDLKVGNYYLCKNGHYIKVISIDNKDRMFTGYEYRAGHVTGNAWNYWQNGVWCGETDRTSYSLHLVYPYKRVNATGKPLTEDPKDKKKTKGKIKVAKKNINDIWTL